MKNLSRPVLAVLTLTLASAAMNAQAVFVSTGGYASVISSGRTVFCC